MQRLGNQQVRPWIDLIKPPHLISFHLANRKSPCARWNRDQATPYFHLSPSLCLSLSHILPASMSAFGLFYGCRFDIPGLKNPGERSISPQAPPSVCCCASDSSDTGDFHGCKRLEKTGTSLLYTHSQRTKKTGDIKENKTAVETERHGNGD